jgi:5-formyltetrahydrofolate cyclo-ligase
MLAEGSAGKAALRAAALARRDRLSPAVRAAGSAAIAARVAPILRDARPRAVGAYRAFGSEADAGAIVSAALAAGINVGLATMVDRETMRFLRYRAEDPLTADAFGILAPDPEAPPIEPDVLIVPVTGFDRSGARLGKGRGIYDRAVDAFRRRGRTPLLVGIAFSVQEVPRIPREPHDLRLDWIVTETETVRFLPAS